MVASLRIYDCRARIHPRPLYFFASRSFFSKLSGNGDEFEAWLVDFRDYAKKCYLNNTATIINRILEVGKRQMKFFQFFNKG